MERSIPRKGDRVSNGMARGGHGHMWKAGSVWLENVLYEGSIRKYDQREGSGPGTWRQLRAIEHDMIRARFWTGFYQAHLRGKEVRVRWQRKTKYLKPKSRPPWQMDQSWMQDPDLGHHTIADAITQASILPNFPPIDPAWCSWLTSGFKISCVNNVSGDWISIIMQKTASICCSHESRCWFYSQYLWPQRIHIFQV